MNYNNKIPLPKITIILLNYNNFNDTINCINSLKKVKYSNFEIIVVDNKSKNNSLEILKSLEDSHIHITSSQKNGGYAYGNNYGIAIAKKHKADFFLLLNNDTVVTDTFINGLLACFSFEKNVGIGTCRIMYNSEPDKIWYAGGKIDWNNLRAVHIGLNKRSYRNSGMEEVDFVSGCCMMISAQCLDKIGGLPEEYFMYYEDLDFCIKAQEAGFKLVYNPEAVIYHCVSSSGGGEDSPFVIEWINRSRRTFYKKYKSYIKKTNRIFVCIKCEFRQIIKIIIARNFTKKIKAYLISFHK